MEFTQQLDAYDHTQCVEAFKWKCLICSVEAKDQVGLEMQHIGDGLFTLIVSMVLSGCAAKNARKLTTWSVLLQKKKKASSSPFIAPLMNVGSRDQVKRVEISKLFSL